MAEAKENSAGNRPNENEVVITTDQTTPEKSKDRGLWRDLAAYWILGLCNNYGYVVMLSAAHDIIHQFQGDLETPAHGSDATSNGRQCNILSTGAVLLADVLPSLFVKMILPFLPFWIHIRIASAVILAAAGFIFVAFAESEGMALLGVICTSASSGIGETSFLAYSSIFDKNVISTWSSGTGGAGIVGSLSYATLRSFKITPRNTMLIMLIVPLIEILAFWGLLRQPQLLPFANSDNVESTERLCDSEKPLVGLKEKLYYIRHLLKYMAPLALVYFFEYFINQGLFELVYFEDSFLDLPSQYRWLNVDYQIGVFISRSSVNLISVNKIWLMSIFQFINVVYFLTEALYFFTPNIWIVFTVVFWEGLLGGGAYVNTFYKMSKEIAPERRKFAMGMVVQSDSFGIALAGFLSMPVHNAICQMAPPIRGQLF